MAAWLAGCRADILRDGRGMLLTEAEAVWGGEGTPVVFLDTAAVAFTTAYLARKMGVSPEDFFERVYVTLDGECGGGWTDDGGRLEERRGASWHFVWSCSTPFWPGPRSRGGRTCTTWSARNAGRQLHGGPLGVLSSR